MRKRLDFKALCYEEELILATIKTNHRGYGLRVSMKQLASRLNMKTRDVRDYIEHLTLLGYAIGNINGYFWIETEAEAQRVSRLAKARLIAASRRYNAIRKLPSVLQLQIGGLENGLE